MELGWWGNYTAEFVCREYFGFGKPPGFQPLLVTGGFIETMWAPTLHQLAEVLGVEVEETRVLYETDCLDHDVQTGFGTVAAGTASVVHFEYQALSGGRPVAVVEHVDCVARDVGSQWKQPYAPSDLAFRVEVEGDPSFAVELSFGAGGDTLSAMPGAQRDSGGVPGPTRPAGPPATYRGTGVATSSGRDDVERRVAPIQHRRAATPARRRHR